MRPPERVRAMLPEGLHYFQSSNWSRTRSAATQARKFGRPAAENAARGLPAGGPLRVHVRGWRQRGQGALQVRLFPAGAGAASDLVGLRLADARAAGDPAGAASRQPPGAARPGGVWRRWAGRCAAQLLPDNRPNQHRRRPAGAISRAGRGHRRRALSPPPGGRPSGLGRPGDGAGRRLLCGGRLSTRSPPGEPSGCHAGPGVGRLLRLLHPACLDPGTTARHLDHPRLRLRDGQRPLARLRWHHPRGAANGLAHLGCDGARRPGRNVGRPRALRDGTAGHPTIISRDRRHRGAGLCRPDRLPDPGRSVAAVAGRGRGRDRGRDHLRAGGQPRGPPGCGGAAVSVFDLDQVRARLTTGEVRWLLHYEADCESTQDLARAAAAQGVEQGWTIVTDFQRGGRGRLGRSWLAPAGQALLFSTILRPPIDVLPLLPLLAAVTVAGGIEVTTGAAPDLKWPNDLILHRQKLAGILLERPAGPAVILGVGVNVNQSMADLPEAATSLRVELGHPVERQVLLAAILNDLANAYDRADREGVDWIVPAWRSRSSMLGRPITFHRNGAPIRGVADDVGNDGALLVRMADGTRVSLVAGEVEQVKLACSGSRGTLAARASAVGDAVGLDVASLVRTLRKVKW